MRLLAIDDGLWSGNLDLADLAFLVAVVLFVFLAVWTWARTRDVVAGLSSLGLAFIAFGLLVL